MSLFLTFIVVFSLCLLAMLLLDGYGRHMGNPEPTDVRSILIISLAVGAIGAGALAVTWEIVVFIWGLFA